MSDEKRMTTEKMPGRVMWTWAEWKEIPRAVFTRDIIDVDVDKDDERPVKLLVITPADFSAYVEERERAAWNAATDGEEYCDKCDSFAIRKYGNYFTWKAKNGEPK